MQTIPEPQTIEEIIALLQDPHCISFHTYRISDYRRGKISYTEHFSIMADYMELDRRICVEVVFYPHTCYIDVQYLSNYNQDKHCWDHVGRKYRVELEHEDIRTKNKIRKPLLKFRDELWATADKYRVHGSPMGYSANRCRTTQKLVVY